MAVITTILTLDSGALTRYQRCIESLTKRVLPEGVQRYRKTRVVKKRGFLLSILGRRDQVVLRNSNVLAGVTVDKNENEPWWRIGGSAPDGSFVLVRSDDSGMEAITDFTGSKSIWHARLPCGGVVASTCLELVVGLLGDFQMDDRALGWFLSSGTCGPRRSWDKRIKPLAPNTRLCARKNGSVINVQEVHMGRPDRFFGEIDQVLLKQKLEQTMSALEYGDKPWLLALSGGYDSRAILYGTRHIENLSCVTWVDEQDIGLPNSDLSIARILAKEAGRKHQVKTISRPVDADSLDRAVRRFVRYCDGRVDNVFAYLDGMQLWDELCASGAGGLLRGDELFGSTFATRKSRILHNMRLASFAEYASGDEQRSLLSRHNHELPSGLRLRVGENRSHWRWRLRADFEIPTVYAALNAIRARFIESSCPLLSRDLVSLAGSMSSKDLDDKSLYKRAVSDMYPNVPIASGRAIVNRREFLSVPQAAELFQDHLASPFAREVLGPQCAQKSSSQLSQSAGHRPAKAGRGAHAETIIAALPVWVKRLRRRFEPAPQLNLPTLVMRSYLASVAQEEMTEAASIATKSWRHIRSVSA